MHKREYIFYGLILWISGKRPAAARGGFLGLGRGGRGLRGVVFHRKQAAGCGCKLDTFIQMYLKYKVFIIGYMVL